MFTALEEISFRVHASRSIQPSVLLSRNYRDSITEGWIERADKLMPKFEVYQKTGQQFARFETCYHLLAAMEQDGDIVKIAEDLLFVPDYLSYLLGAKKYTEYTIASVTNLYNILENKWDDDIFHARCV